MAETTGWVGGGDEATTLFGATEDDSEVEGLGALPATENRRPAADGIGGLFTNLYRDFEDIGSGIGDLIGVASHDVVHAGAELFTGGQASGGFMTDDVVKAMPSAIISDYKSRYGGGVGNIAENIYEHPLSFISDALTVATAGGAGIVKVGQATGQIAKAVDIASAAGKTADVINTASKAGDIATAASAFKAARETSYVGNAATAAAGDVAKAGGFWNRVAGQVKFVRDPLTGHVNAVTPTLNPVKRQFEKGFEHLITTKGPGTEATEATAEAAEQALAGKGNILDFNQAEALESAAAAGGASLRVYRPFAAKFKLQKAVDHIYGTAKASSKARQMELLSGASSALERIQKELGLDAEQAGTFLQSMNAPDGTLGAGKLADGYVVPEGHGARITEHFDDPTGMSQLNTPHDALGWGGTYETVQQAQAQAFADAKAIIPGLRKRLGAGTVIPAGAKDTQAINRTAAMKAANNNLAGWRGADDISRAGIVLDRWDSAGKAVSQIQEELASQGLGGRLVSLENNIYTPDAGGERFVRVVMEVQGEGGTTHPMEFKLMTRKAWEVHDSSGALRKDISQTHILAADKKYMKNAKIQPSEMGERIRESQAYSQTLWEGVTDEVREELGLGQTSELRKALHDYRIQVHKHITDPSIGSGMLDPRSAFRDTYLPMRMRQGAHFDYEAKDFVDDPGALALHQSTVEAGLPAPVYTPLVDGRRITSNGDYMMTKPTSGLGGINKDMHMRRNTGYLFEKGYYEKNPIRALAVRSQRAQRARESREIIMNAVSHFGRPLENAEDLHDGEMAVSLSALKNVFAHQQAIDDAAMRSLTEGPGMDTAVKDVLEAISEDSVGKAKNLPREQLYAVPTIVGKRLNDHARAWFGSAGNSKVSVAWRNGTQAWKGAVLSGSPRWVTNNLIGNIVFAKLQGARLTDVLKQLSPRYLKKMREAFGEEALAEIESGGMFGGNEVRQVGEVLARQEDTVAGAISSKFAGRAIPHPLRRAGNVTKRINGELEDAFRRASYLKAAERESIRRGTLKGWGSFFSSKKRLESAFSTGLDENSWHRAIDEVNKAFNDYGAMTPFGRNVLRPYIAPFWGFYRHATKTLLQMPFDHPAKAWLLNNIAMADEDVNGDIGPLPSWLNGSIPLGTGNSAAETRFLSTRGPNPFNAVLETPLNLIHPAWKMAFERGTGRSSYTGQDFTAPDVVKPFGSDNQYRVTTDKDGRPVMEPIENVAPGLVEMLAQQVPQYDLVKDLVARGKTYDTATLLDAVRGNAAMLDSETGEVRYPSNTLKALGKWLGYNTYDMDVEEYQAKLTEEQEQGYKYYQESHPEATGETTGFIGGA